MIDRWGANPTERPFPVHAEHEDAFRRFAAHANRNGRRFILGIVGVALALLALAVAAPVLDLDPRRVAFGVGAGTAVIGGMSMAWPFATPETVGVIGLERSIRLVRVFGGGLVSCGVAIMAFLG